MQGEGDSKCTCESKEPTWAVTYFDPPQWSRRFPGSFFTMWLPSYEKAVDGTHFLFRVEVRCGANEWFVVRVCLPSARDEVGVHVSSTGVFCGSVAAADKLCLRLVQLRRFREFVQLWRDMGRALPSATLPRLPPTTWSRSHTRDDDVVRNRHQLLGVALRDMLRLRGATCVPAMREFLQLGTAHGSTKARTAVKVQP